MDDLTAANQLALSMMSKTFHFEMKNPIYESLRNLGDCRVVAVVIEEKDIPALGLLDSQNKIDYYSIAEVTYFEPIKVAA